MVVARLARSERRSGTSGPARIAAEAVAMALAVAIGAFLVARCGLYFGSFFAVVAVFASTLPRRGVDGLVTLIIALPVLVFVWVLIGAGLFMALDLGFD
ncbi:hypothetical protein E8D34_07275 [Nocardioides sp. GY 10113]|uniref:hypothetical protein n=1 Tax=Nocardioides sp. GY 10113 TaxID=2569761 RepID=UPI0010A8715D|nr:hypothetical protein [Nocardioides sp. GY 10113]TIC88079.1 hypothetical protein E8D34_07275 [Nocardioides sp. GY 10113]